MIKNIIFDMGNVLKSFSPMLCIAPYVKDESDACLISDEMFGKEEWRLLDSGELIYEEAVARVKLRLPDRLHGVLDEIIAHWHEHMPQDKRMLELVKSLKSNGYKMYLLSNASVRFAVYKDTFEALKYFDGAIVSAFYHVLKPDEKIYRILFDTFNLNPRECFFVDDNADNVEGGRRLHMDGHVFTGDVQAMLDDFAANGIHV